MRLVAQFQPHLHHSSFSGIVDMLSILPILVLFFDLPASFGFVRFLRVFRVVRVLRLHRLLAAQVSAVRHQVLSLAFTTVSLIFCAAGTMHAISVVDPAAFVDVRSGAPGESLESPDSMSFFTAVYFVVVSIATVGYGDIGEYYRESASTNTN
jgi:hypothetical protein